MSYEIEIEFRDYECVVFYLGEVPYEVEIETETSYEEYPNSYNSFNDKITYVEEEVTYYYVKESSLKRNGEYYSDKDLCDELERILNR